MPRQARKKSKTGIYHVMLRGINQQQIFEDSEDFSKFLQVLKDCKAKGDKGTVLSSPFGKTVKRARGTVFPSPFPPLARTLGRYPYKYYLRAVKHPL